MVLYEVEGVVVIVVLLDIVDGVGVGRLCLTKKWGLTSNDETIGNNHKIEDGTVRKQGRKYRGCAGKCRVLWWCFLVDVDDY